MKSPYHLTNPHLSRALHCVLWSEGSAQLTWHEHARRLYQSADKNCLHPTINTTHHGAWSSMEHWLYVARSSVAGTTTVSSARLYLAATIKLYLAAMCQNHCLHSIFTQSEECQQRWRGWSYRHVDVTITIILHVLFQAGCNLTITHTAKSPRPQLRGGRLPGAWLLPSSRRCSPHLHITMTASGDERAD